MGNIVLLDELTINKIAAGEVIERPSSVIKEMVENSLDAGANNITIEIENGGITYIRITDNGKGISKDDMEIAFERHATSKIRVADDLEIVKSMGFRGEALASIAAIANIEMVSKTKDSEIGNKIIVEAGKVLEKEEIGCPNGTSITVKNLFFNTPVRYKFLKKDFTEAGYIEDIVTRLVLAHPKVAVKLIIGGKTILQTSGNGDIEEVIYNIYGRDIAKGLIEVDFEYEDMKVSGVIGKPEISRNNRTNQMFFVNNRFVKDKTLSASAEQALKGLLPIGKFAFIVLNVDMDPKKVDVNVHPAKLEVRFEEEQKVFKAVYNAIKESMLKTELIKNSEQIASFEKVDKEEIVLEEQKTQKIPTFIDLFKKKKINSDYTMDEEENIEPQKENIIEQIYNNKESLKENKENYELLQSKREMKVPTEEQVSAMASIISNSNNIEIERSEEKVLKNEEIEKSERTIPEIQETKKISVQEIQNEEVKEKFDEMYARAFGKLPTVQTEEIKEDAEKIDLKKDIKENVSLFETEKEFISKPNYKFIGIAFSTYIIIEMDNQMYIIDQHAAHERINYEKIKQNFYSISKKDTQLMLLPDIITLTHKELSVVNENEEIFKQAGFEFEEFGENTIKLTGVPSMCMELETKELFLEILDAMDTVAITAKQEKEEKFIATIACKASVKANMALTEAEVIALMEQLLKLPNPFTCPHGRPTAIKMTKYDIERKFNRK